MPLDDLLVKLNNYLDEGQRKKKAHCDRIDDLLEKLKDKQKLLEGQLKKEENSKKRKRIKTELKVVEAQLKKGKKRREELDVKCK